MKTPGSDNISGHEYFQTFDTFKIPVTGGYLLYIVMLHGGGNNGVTLDIYKICP